MKSSSLVLIVLLVACSAGCSAPPPPATVREFPLTGEVLAIKPDTSEIQVKHDEVKVFMEPMTMWFNIKDPRLLDGVAPGWSPGASAPVSRGVLDSAEPRG